MRRAVALLVGCVLGAAPAGAAPVIAALAPSDDAREVVLVGPAGEVYRPDGNGGWVRTQPITTAGMVAHAGRAGGAIVAIADGIVYRLAANGWSALRLVQKGKAVMSTGSRAIAAVGRQLFALDAAAGGEPTKLAVAPAAVLAIGAGASALTIATERGLYRYEGRGFKHVRRAPRRVDRLVGDRWAIVDGALVELPTGKRPRLPAGVSLAVAAPGPDGPVAAGSGPDGPVLVRVKAGKVDVTALPATLRGATAVGVVADKAGRVLVAFQNGRLVLRDRDAWSEAAVRVELPAPRPGRPPAREGASAP